MQRLLLLSLGVWLLATSASAQTPVVLAWDASVVDTAGDNAPMSYTLAYGPVTGKYTVLQNVGLVTQAPLTLPPGTWFIAASAANANGVSPYSNEVSTTIAPLQTGCADGQGPMTIGIKSYTTTVPIGTQGAVVFSIISGPQSVTQIKILLGASVGWEVDGTELRGILGVAFAVPTTAGTYNLTVQLTDTRGCVQVTPEARPVVVP